MNELAEEFGINRRTVSAILTRNGVERRAKGLSDQQRADARRLYEDEGLSPATIGRSLGFNAATIRTELIEAGVRMRDTQGRTR